MLSPAIIGFAVGAVIPLAVLRYYFYPQAVRANFNAIELMKHDLEYATWHLRLVQRHAGVADKDLYYPNGRFRGLAHPE